MCVHSSHPTFALSKKNYSSFALHLRLICEVYLDLWYLSIFYCMYFTPPFSKGQFLSIWCHQVCTVPHNSENFCRESNMYYPFRYSGHVYEQGSTSIFLILSEVGKTIPIYTETQNHGSAKTCLQCTYSHDEV